ncbi:MAG: HpcH/HpaI aldolase/citrate lyase family protein, partial [Xanthobacteraceae bacterium]
ADLGMLADAAGFDGFYIDMEHSPVSLDTVAAMSVAALPLGVTPMARIPGHDFDTAARLLDAGALGIICPQVETAEQAKAFVAAAKFPPLGHRSVAGAGPLQYYRTTPLADVNKQGNELTLCIPMLETAKGVENADAIAAVPGIDILLIGSNDLSAALGIPGDLKHAKIRAAYETTAAACKKHGKALGVGGVRGDYELTRSLVALGAKFVIAGQDTGYLTAAAKADAAAMRRAISS